MTSFACAPTPSVALCKVGHENSARRGPKGMIMDWTGGGDIARRDLKRWRGPRFLSIDGWPRRDLEVSLGRWVNAH